MTPKPKDGTIAILSALLVLVTALLAPLLAVAVSILVPAASCSPPRYSS